MSTRVQWKTDLDVTCVICPSCSFAFDQQHEDDDGGYSCPMCRVVQLEAERDTWGPLGARDSLIAIHESTLDDLRGVLEVVRRAFYPGTFTECWTPETCAETVADGEPHGGCPACVMTSIEHLLAPRPTEREGTP